MRSRQQDDRALPRAMSLGSTFKQSLEDVDRCVEFFHVRRAEQWFAEQCADWFINRTCQPYDRAQMRINRRVPERPAERDVRDAGILGDEVVLVAFALDDAAQALTPVGHDPSFRFFVRSRMSCAA